MLNSDMNIDRIITHAQQIEEKNIKMREKQNKSIRTSSFSFAQPKSEGENCSQFCPKSSVLAPCTASAPVPKFREGNKDRGPGSKTQGSVSNA